jgi:hypothetical protein
MRGERESERVKGKRGNQRIRQEGREENIEADKQGGSEEGKKEKEGMGRKVIKRIVNSESMNERHSVTR